MNIASRSFPVATGRGEEVLGLLGMICFLMKGSKMDDIHPQARLISEEEEEEEHKGRERKGGADSERDVYIRRYIQQ